MKINKFFIFISLVTIFFTSLSFMSPVSANIPSRTPPPIFVPSRNTILGTEVDGYFTDRYFFSNDVLNTNTSFVRIASAYWRTGEPTQGNYVYDSQYAITIRHLMDNGIKPILVVRTVPDWASNQPGSACGPINPLHYADYAKYINKLIENYGVNYVELFNEPDLPGDPDGYIGCFPTGKSYVDMLKVAYPIIKNAHPYAQVVAGSIAGDPSSDWFKDAVSNGIGKYSDIVSFHAYQIYGYSYTTPISHIRTLELKAMLPGKPLMMSEGALAAGTENITPAIRQAQSNYLQSAVSWAQTDGLVAYIHFRIISLSFFHTELFDPVVNKNIYDAGTPNSVFYTYKNLSLEPQKQVLYNVDPFLIKVKKPYILTTKKK